MPRPCWSWGCSFLPNPGHSLGSSARGGKWGTEPRSRGANQASFCRFSHCCDQITNRQPLTGAWVYFGSQSEGTGITARKGGQEGQKSRKRKRTGSGVWLSELKAHPCDSSPPAKFRLLKVPQPPKWSTGWETESTHRSASWLGDAEPTPYSPRHTENATRGSWHDPGRQPPHTVLLILGSPLPPLGSVRHQPRNFSQTDA